MHKRRHCTAVTALLLVVVAVPGSSFTTPCGGAHPPGRYHRYRSRQSRQSTWHRSTAPTNDINETKNDVDNNHTSLPLGEPTSPSDVIEQCGSAEHDASATLLGEDVVDVIARLVDSFVALKEELYARIRRILADLVTIITRSVQTTEAWVRDDAVGQLVSSALGLVVFFVAVAAFAAWNVELLGGKKWSGPAGGVTIPVVRVPDGGASSSAAAAHRGGGGVTFQQPTWKAPKIQTSYTKDNNSPSATDAAGDGAQMID